jgi:hypothetical protein
MRVGMNHVRARAAAEPAGVLVVADEDPGVMATVAVFDPDLVTLLETVEHFLFAHGRSVPTAAWDRMEVAGPMAQIAGRKS